MPVTSTRMVNTSTEMKYNRIKVLRKLFGESWRVRIFQTWYIEHEHSWVIDTFFFFTRFLKFVLLAPFLLSFSLSLSFSPFPLFFLFPHPSHSSVRNYFYIQTLKTLRYGHDTPIVNKILIVRVLKCTCFKSSQLGSELRLSESTSSIVHKFLRTNASSFTRYLTRAKIERS